MATKQKTEEQTFAPSFKLRPNQKAALPLLGNPLLQYVLLAGGGRSGKTFLIILVLILKALEYPGSRHAVFRRTRNSCEATCFNITLFQVLNALHPALRSKLKVNIQNLTVTFQNGSVITFDGLDENRREKVLGSEWQTIYVNECNEFEYEDIEVLGTRLNGEPVSSKTGEVIVRKMFFCCNPNVETDWECVQFRDGKSPATNKKLADPEKYAWVQVNNDDEKYLAQYANATAATKNRYVKGIWSTFNENAMFNMEMFDKHRVTHDELPDRFKRITINIDPSASANKKSDLCGLTVTALDYKDHAYVLADHSDVMAPAVWARKAIELFDSYKADAIVAERNNGGQMVAETIYRHRQGAPVKLVWASRGKDSRAEPVSFAYNDGRIHHVGDLDDLEREMCAFGAKGNNKSPDRLDSVVWGMFELLQIEDTKGPGRFKPKRSTFF